LMTSAIILGYCSLRAAKVFIFADGTVQLVRPKCSFWSDIFSNMARKTLLTYPVRILSKKGFIEYNKCTDTVCFNNNLFSKFNNSALTHIKSLCEKNLEQYYSTIK